MRREITVFVCLVVIGDGRYLSGDRKSYESQRHFELQEGLKESSNTKREVKAYTPENQSDRAQPERNTYASRSMFEEYESYVDNRYELALLPDYVIYNRYINSKSESTAG